MKRVAQGPAVTGGKRHQPRPDGRQRALALLKEHIEVQRPVPWLNCIKAAHCSVAALQAIWQAAEHPSALKNAREDSGKSVSPHVFINEHNIIYGIVLGCSAKLYRDRRKLPKNANIRDHVKDDELVAIAHLQHIVPAGRHSPPRAAPGE